MEIKYSILVPSSKGKFFFVKKRMDIRWGDISSIKLEFKLFRMAYENGPYMYYHLLSGVDLPIKSQDYIHEFFKKIMEKSLLVLLKVRRMK